MSKKNNTIAIICWIVVGLVIGYLIFGKVNGNMISLKTLCLPAENGIKKLASKAADLGSIRLKILACGAAGAVFGYVFGKMRK
jgi:hypothetical protein